MKQFNVLAVGLLLACTAFFTSCDDEKEETKPIEVENKEALTQDVFADKTEGSGVTFATTGAWTSTIKPKTARSESTAKNAESNWIAISPSSGNAGGTYTVELNIEPNTTGADRSAAIIINCADTEITINVTQKATKEDGNPMLRTAKFEVFSCNNEWSPENNTPYFAAEGAEIIIMNADSLSNTYTTNADGRAEIQLQAGEYTYIVIREGESNLMNGIIITGIYTTEEAHAPEGYTVLGSIRPLDANGDGIINDLDKVDNVAFTIGDQDESFEVYIAPANFEPTYKPFYFEDITSNASFRNMATKAYILDAGITRDTTYSESTYRKYNNFSYTAQDSCISTLWNEAYNVIKLANATLERADTASVLTAEEKKHTIANALYSRMYAYSLLVNYFGEVPIQTSSYFANHPGHTVEEIKQFITADADRVIEHGQDANGWHNAARQVKARQAINEKNYQEAYQLTKVIIESGNYSLNYVPNQAPLGNDAISNIDHLAHPYPAELRKWAIPLLVMVTYRETLLMNAEAANESGMLGDALQIINMFRQQYSQAPLNSLSQEEARNNIISLWKQVLNMEGQTFAMLKRTETFLSTLGTYGASEKHLLLPIPASVINDNPNLSQNPGW